MADMMKYTGAINILRSDRILPRAWRLEIADMLETMEKHREISTLDDRHSAGPAGTDGLTVREALVSLVHVVSNMRVPQNVADAALQVTVIGPVLERAKAVLQETSPGAGPASADGLIHGALYVYDATTQTFDPAVPSAWQRYAGGSWQTVSKRDVRDPEQYAKSIGPARAIYYVGDQR